MLNSPAMFVFQFLSRLFQFPLEKFPSSFPSSWYHLSYTVLLDHYQQNIPIAWCWHRHAPLWVQYSLVERPLPSLAKHTAEDFSRKVPSWFHQIKSACQLFEMRGLIVLCSLSVCYSAGHFRWRQWHHYSWDLQLLTQVFVVSLGVEAHLSDQCHLSGWCQLGILAWSWMGLDCHSDPILVHNHLDRWLRWHQVA